MSDHTSDLLIPSIPASQALRLQFQASSQPSSSAPLQQILSPVSTGLVGLDYAISASAAASGTAAGTGAGGGFARGSVSEVYGPPGVGKTSLLLNTAVKALAAGQHVVWIDTGPPIPKPRLQQLLEAAHTHTHTHNNSTSSSSSSLSKEEMTQNLTHIRTPSLPQLVALLAHPPPNFPPVGTSLLVVDSVSAPFPSYFPNATEIRSRLASASSTTGGGKEQQQQQQTQWLLNRKRNVTSDLASHAAKLASTRGLAVVLLNQTHTKIRGLPRPTLYPALATAGAWESCISSRIVIYREFFSDISGKKRKEKVRFAEMMKKGGKVLAARTEEDIVRFIIDDNGLRELNLQPESTPQTISLPVSVRKRKVGEIADSEEESEFEDEEEYDWEGT